VSVNAGINIRIGQLAILAFFMIVFLIDLKKHTLNEPLIFFFLFFGLLISLISYNSSYSKIGEIKFIIKYILIFPAAFYIGQWIVQNLPKRKFLKAIEITMALDIFMAFLLFIYPISFLYNDRGELSGFQGTFLEAGWFSLVLGALTLTSILIRLDYGLKFTNLHFLLYFFAIVSQFLSKNKTIWLALLIIMFFLVFIKMFISEDSKIKKSVLKLRKINSFNFIAIAILFLIIFFGINLMLDKPIISIAMIEEKLNDERGKAFLAAITLLQNSDWLGSYGFGFIQQYFSVYTDEIIGLDADSSMIFNSYLDVWISVGLIGLLYHIILLKMSFSISHLFTLIIPVYWFIFSNTNPTMGVEEYYLFLGIAYGLTLNNKKEEIN